MCSKVSLFRALHNSQNFIFFIIKIFTKWFDFLNFDYRTWTMPVPEDTVGAIISTVFLFVFFTFGSLLSLPISTYIQKSINFRTITLTFHIPSGLDYRLSQQSKCSGDLDCSGAPQNTPKLPTEAGHRTGSLENSVFSTNRVPLSPSAYNKVSKFY